MNYIFIDAAIISTYALSWKLGLSLMQFYLVKLFIKSYFRGEDVKKPSQNSDDVEMKASLVNSNGEANDLGGF